MTTRKTGPHVGPMVKLSRAAQKTIDGLSEADAMRMGISHAAFVRLQFGGYARAATVTNVEAILARLTE